MRFHDYFVLEITTIRAWDYIRFTVDVDTCFDYIKQLKAFKYPINVLTISIYISINNRNLNTYLYIEYAFQKNLDLSK